MKAWQRGIQYMAMALAIALCIAIIGGIVRGLSFLPGLFGTANEASVGDRNTFTPTGTVTGLELEIGAAALEIRTGEAFRLESNLKSLTAEETNGIWKIREKQKFIGTNLHGAYLTLYIPVTASLDTVKLDTGAGKVDIEALTAGTLDLELGAGSFRAAALTATRQAEIDGGSGQLCIESGDLHDLDLDMGAGRTELTARLSGSCSLEMGVGAAAITLLGSREEYRLSIDKGLGDVLIAGESVGDGAAVGDGNTRVKLSGGVGRITVDYREDTAV